MKLIKNIIVLLITSILCLSTIPVFAQTQDKDQTLSTETAKIQLEEAINQGNTPVGTATLTNENTGLTYNVEVYALQTTSTSTYYVASTDHMTVVPESIPISTRGDGSHSDSRWDTTSSALFSLGFDFNRSGSNIQLTYVWGNVSTNSGVGVSSSTVFVKQFCPYTGVNESRSYSPYSSFGYHTSFSGWVPDSSGSTFGASWNATLSRGGSSWSFSLPVYRYL